jgi:hypothetical protein
MVVKTQPQEINQTKCWIATGGHIWMRGYFDTLPVVVRQRLRDSPFNLCPACLVTEFLPKVEGASRERRLLAAIEIMEAEIRKGDPPVRPQPTKAAKRRRPK